MSTFKVRSILAFLFIFAFAVPAHADPSPSPSPTPLEKKAGDNAPAAGVDELITNNNLRALSGSKSRWSIASTFNYEGGSISNPFSQDRPDISQASGTTTKSDLDGNISAKYNIDTKNSIMAGIGIRWIAPLASNVTDYDGDRFDFINPYIQYQYIYKWFGVQSVLQVGFLQWTQTDQTAIGYGQQLNIDQENMYEIGSTGLSIGASTYIQYQWFNKSGPYGSPSDSTYISDVAMNQSQYSFGIAPIVEYQLSDKVNLRTLVSPLTFEHYRAQTGSFAFIRDLTYQSFGVGVSITRDIFLYPNVQFLPQEIQSQLTNVGLTATINLF
jgi:hypothetical protein